MGRVSTFTYFSLGAVSIAVFTLLGLFQGFSAYDITRGFLVGLSFILFYAMFDRWVLKWLTIKTLTTVLLGTLLGLFLGKALLAFLGTLLPSASFSPFFQAAIYLFSTFTSLLTLLRTSGKTYIQLPFVKLSSLGIQEKSLLIDRSTLADVRFPDLIESGILSQHLIIPTFIQQSLTALDEEAEKVARENLGKIEEQAQRLNLSYSFPELSFSNEKCYLERLKKASRLFRADVLTAHLTEENIALPQGNRFIALQHLANILKAAVKTEETFKIKVQRLGKEPGQGVGYLENGTMVVINGGGNFIGEEVLVRVISTKHSSSGRIVFCNFVDPETSLSKKKASLIEETCLK